MRKIGLISGLAMRAGVFYYERLVAAGASRVMLNHAGVETVLALVAASDRAVLGSYLGGLANELFDGGAELVAITAVAPHMALAEIASVARGPLVSALDGLAGQLPGPVAVFGNRAVIESDVYGALPPAHVIRWPAATVERVNTLYTDIARRGLRGAAAEVAALEALAAGARAAGAQALVLAGTDLSSFYADARPTYLALDMAALHIAEILRRAA